jgi:D-glycero-alpha-D-manno-heptose-7-phosphate kinase
LGTSSAFTVGLLLALYALKNKMRDKHRLAADAIHVEQELLREAVGAQDQVSAAYGGFNRINFQTDGTIEVRRVLTAPTRLAELEQHLALYFTGFSRIASEVAKEQIRLTPHRTKELETMYQMVNEAEDIITNPNSPIEEFGKMLHESWKLKRTLTQSISTASIDEIYEAGRSAGALGGKLLGAGGGGFMLFFVPPERRRELRLRLQKLLCIPFGLSNRGSHVVVYEPEEVYDKSLTDERGLVYGRSNGGAAEMLSLAQPSADTDTLAYQKI